jgi:hypothetical protein
VAPRVSPTEAIRAEIHELFESDGELLSVLEPAKFRFDVRSRHLRGSGSAPQAAASGSTRAVVREVPLPAIPGTFVGPATIVSRGSRESVAVLMDLDELVDQWTLLKDERELVAGKRGPTRLGFALLLKFYAQAGRFPRGRAELDDDAVAFVARQVGVPASDLGFYEWAGSTIEYHRAQIGRHLGFRDAPPRTPASSPSGWPPMSARLSGGPTGAGGAAGPVPRRADRATVRGPLRPDYPLGPAPGRASADGAGGRAARPGRQRMPRRPRRGRRR